MQDPSHAPVRWLVAANALWVVAGLVAYATSVTMLVGGALAAAVAVPGLRALRNARAGEHALWLDRAMSYAVGTWATLVVVVLLPLMTLDEGGNLWEEKGYWLVGLLVANGGFLLLNASAFRAVAPPGAARAARSYALFHGALLVLSIYFLVTADHARVEVEVAGRLLEAYDLRMAPALAAVPGVTWALGFWRLREAPKPA